jgi:FAD synthetase
MDDFISQQQINFSFNLTKLPRDFKLIKTLIDSCNLKSIFMGSRSTDPFCQQLSFFSPSDIQNSYPPFMRVNPILFWHHGQVWQFLRENGFQYCSLYEQGYTYLGNMKNSYRNPTLREQGGEYRPAWECKGLGDFR